MSTEHADPDRETEPETEAEQVDTEPAGPADEPTGSPTEEESTESAPAETDDSEEGTNDSSETVPDDPPAAFRATIQAARLKTVLASLRAIVDEARIRVTDEGVSVRAVDQANVVMDDLDLSAAAFESFDAAPGTLGVNLDRLAEPVGLASKDDLVQLHLDPESKKLLVVVDDLQYSMACLDPASIRAEPDIPEFDLPTRMTIDQSVLLRGVKAADLVAEAVTIRMDTDAESLFIEAEGDTDTVSLDLDVDDIEIVTAEDASALFSLPYLKKLVRTIPKRTAVTVDLGDSFPVALSYEFADGEGVMSRMLAPRIET